LSVTNQEYEAASGKAIDQLATDLRPIVEGAGDLGLDAILDLPEAKQAIAAWGVKNDVAALSRGGKVASWLVGALRRRALGEKGQPAKD
jgi:hypothetical protein